MKIQIRSVANRIVQVQTELSSYTCFIDRKKEIVTLVGPGLNEEYDVDSFPGDEPELYAITAYLIASLEAQLYGD